MLGDREVYYVCSPTSVIISAQNQISNRRITVTFKIGKKDAYVRTYRTTLEHYDSPNRQDLLDMVVKRTIKDLMSRQPSAAKKTLDFLAYIVYSSLNEVRTKSGTLIWRK
jgi:hypothetical protein